MDFNEYQKRAIKFDTAYVPTSELDLCYGYMEKLLGLAGEAGEVLEKVKKKLRDDGSLGGETKEEIEAIGKELGDVLWYLSAIADYNHLSLQDIAENNLKKLEDRKKRNQIHGSGDNR